ncbi:Sjogren's syndrome/scleroderma autoantigen 1 family protein [Halorubrum vacuolatum]|uniref:Sjogren's syndrome/scleroderma autoantigen 1 (Autoantigen p27) n=1 Tax=Halorubrum vacuolatum TaxID=63740 RepID=A0A238VVC7_HALVU|nr:Sjogren's syndrome/scleroderma autoantigen 1 family protein [Halorubrum vacuolatum]SNR38292.1 Sjogren's syndrome/scleroderma autoantigen 1 (Autoantigen p27) [Halorubrum vacuolatum]
MSEGFDKEAEREKLRKKFAADDQKREHTKRMSELLLKGATMTNRHCETCGDPIFRHDGQEFCPSCNATTNGTDGEQAPAGTDETTHPSGATEADAHDSAAVTPADPVDGTTGPTGTDEAHEATNVGGRNPPDTPAQGPQPGAGDVQPASPSARPEGPVESGHGEVATDVATARASLTRTLVRFAQAAEQTDDPRRARDHLRAAREAAETLRALE